MSVGFSGLFMDVVSIKGNNADNRAGKLLNEFELLDFEIAFLIRSDQEVFEVDLGHKSTGFSELSTQAITCFVELFRSSFESIDRSEVPTDSKGDGDTGLDIAIWIRHGFLTCCDCLVNDVSLSVGLHATRAE
jgi:hypothetical protein